MKKYNLLFCLFISIFSCTQNTNQITPIKSPSSSPSRTTTNNNQIPSPVNNEKEIKLPDFNIYDQTYQSSISLDYNENIIRSYPIDYDFRNFYFIGNKELVIKPKIVFSRTYSGTVYNPKTDNYIYNFKFESSDKDVIVSDEGIITFKNLKNEFSIKITYKPLDFKFETFNFKLIDYNKIKEFYNNDSESRGSAYGNVYDVYENKLKDVFVNISYFEPSFGKDLLAYFSKDLVNKELKLTDKDGFYLIKDVFSGARLLILAYKKGYTYRTRSEVLHMLYGDIDENRYDFSTIYALQNEPEINSLEINGITVNGSSIGDVFVVSKDTPKNIKPTILELSNVEQLKGIGNIPSVKNISNKNLEVKMCFSEEVDKKSVEDNFRIQSQMTNYLGISENIDNKNSNLRFEWYKKELSGNLNYIKLFDPTFDSIPCVKATYNESLKANLTGEELKYLIDFKAPFQDLEGNKAIDRRYFRFSPSQINDFAVFSVQNNDNLSPIIENIEAINRDTSNDIIKIFFNQKLKKYLKDSLPLLLKSNNNLKDDNYYRDYTLNKEKDNSTILGYLNNGTFYGVYMIGKIEANDIDKTNKIKSLGTNENFDTEPKKVYTNPMIKNVSVNDDVVILEFDSKAFSKDDAIILSLGKNINGRYIKNNEKQNQTLSVFDWERINYYKFIDFSLPQFSMENHEIKPNSIITSDPLQVSTFAKEN